MNSSDIHAGIVYGDDRGNTYQVESVYATALVSADTQVVKSVILRIVNSVDDNLKPGMVLVMQLSDFCKWAVIEVGPARPPAVLIEFKQVTPQIPGWYAVLIPGVVSTPVFVLLVVAGDKLQVEKGFFSAIPNNAFWSPRMEFQVGSPDPTVLVKIPLPNGNQQSEPGSNAPTDGASDAEPTAPTET